ncbi:MAG TPA: Uma2 family endonuclease [Pyrinomonadaceae bacterium]|nr:Uma2 family endonuclease [Pyrinomonadaceae bacterium]
MSATTELVTAEQLFSMPSENFRYELRKGVLTKMSWSSFEHVTIVATLTAKLFPFVNENCLGVICGAETGFRLSTDPATVLAPDVSD